MKINDEEVPCCLCLKKIRHDEGVTSAMWSKDGIPVVIVFHHKCFKKWHKQDRWSKLKRLFSRR